ncbi:MAG: hypothetical protein IH935_10175 [Acidobacteria bacterium]|nr:hypothetical protein [Acidobacteriota bacterium]
MAKSREDWAKEQDAFKTVKRRSLKKTKFGRDKLNAQHLPGAQVTVGALRILEIFLKRLHVALLSPGWIDNAPG